MSPAEVGLAAGLNPKQMAAWMAVFSSYFRYARQWTQREDGLASGFTASLSTLEDTV